LLKKRSARKFCLRFFRPRQRTTKFRSRDSL
jgi:hypothetical protein